MKMNLTTLLLSLIVCAGSLFVTGCPMFQKETPATFSDGAPAYIDPTDPNKVTREPTAPDGTPNKPAVHFSSTGAAEQLVKTGGMLPPPFGGIIEIIGGVGLSGLALYFRRKNAATDAAIAEYESKIRAKPEAAEAVDKHVWDNLSPATVTKLLPIKAAT